MKFESFNIKKELVEVLNELGYVEATDIQSVVIPKMLKNKSVIAKSATGSGKTHAFLVPIINNLEFDKGLQALIITPTRDLAEQTFNFLKEFKKYYPNLNIKLFTSGIDVSRNVSNISNNNSQIIVATPGRIKSIFGNSDFGLEDVKTIVLDEADMLSETGFFDDIEGVINKCNNAQISVFSATINQKVEVFLRKFISPDYILDVDDRLIPNTIHHFFVNTKHINLNDCLEIFIKNVNPYLLFIFANTKKEVNDIYEYLYNNDYNCCKLTGDLSPRERKSLIKRIKNDTFQIVVCSDIAARGIDVENVSDVLSVNVPNNFEYYFHRCGRTGRINKNGNSYVFYSNDSIKDIKKIIDSGIDGKYLKITNNELINDKELDFTPKKKRVNKELEKEIQKVKSMSGSKKVKPMYKKKVKFAIDKTKRKFKRDAIKKDIRRQRVERYKNEAKYNG